MVWADERAAASSCRASISGSVTVIVRTAIIASWTLARTCSLTSGTSLSGATQPPESGLSSACVKDVCHGQAKRRQYDGREGIVPPEAGCFLICRVPLGKHRDRFVARIHQPIFRDAAGCVLSALGRRIAPGIVRADDLHYKIGSRKELVSCARIVDIEHCHEVRPPVLAGREVKM